jgi:pyridinium-3,5-biscarboxylic acid mononucleotide synthase
VADLPGDSRLQDALAAFGGFGTSPERHSIAGVGDFARLDLDRQAQSGRPEVIYAAGKTPEQVVAIAERLLAAHGRAIVSRLGEAQHAALVAAFAGADGGVVVERRAGYPTATVRRADAPELPVVGRVGILTAGTTDLPVADEARVMAEAMGCRVSLVADVGVAGLARLFGPLRALLDEGAGALLAMLQTCAPGLTVVNIDNGIGAGAAAAMIARGRQ